MALKNINQEWDKCLLRTLDYGFKGAVSGFLIGLLFFKRKSLSAVYFSGLGIGCSYYECEKKFNNLLNEKKT